MQRVSVIVSDDLLKAIDNARITEYGVILTRSEVIKEALKKAYSV